MPEGDTIYKVAARLRPLLVGRALAAVRTRGGRDVRSADPRVTAIESHGKHMLIRLADGPALRVHLGMKGSWHRYAPGEVWQRAAATATLVLETATDVLVCFKGQVELVDPAQVATHPGLSGLGPDLLDAEFDPADAARRAQAAGGVIGVVLQDQRVAAGIGNVYRSELLFLLRLAPMTPVAAIPLAQLEALYREGQRLMQANLVDRPRTTRPGGGSRYYVYRRVGRPCFRCHTRIAQQRQGDLARVTYWCPRCQGPSSAWTADAERGTTWA